MSSPTISFIADVMQPDLYNDVCNLPNPFLMNIPIGISNSHPTQTLYFKASIISPPADYAIYSTNLGSLAHGANSFFYFTPLRAMPTLTAGEYDETVTFRITAYTDAGYSSEYAHQDLSVNIHHFNHADGSWSVINHTTFDDDTMGGWQAGSPALTGTNTNMRYLTNSVFLSAPNCAVVNSLLSNQHSYFDCGNTSGYSKIRFILHWRKAEGQYSSAPMGMAVFVNSTMIRSNSVAANHYPPTNTWCRESFGIPTGTSTVIKFGFYISWDFYVSYVDEIWIIAK